VKVKGIEPCDPFQCISWQQAPWCLCFAWALPPQNSQILYPSPARISPSSIGNLRAFNAVSSRSIQFQMGNGERE